MSIRDSGGFAIMRRADLDNSGAKIWEACIHIGNGQHATIRYTKSDLQYIRALIGRELKADKEESK